jgi:VTC domain
LRSPVASISDAWAIATIKSALPSLADRAMTESRNDDLSPRTHDGSADPSLSPSLRPATAAKTPSFELKFVITPDRAAAIEDWARAQLKADPHGETPGSGRYATTTLYLDTADLAIFHRAADTTRKYRIRRYDAAGAVYLETKERRGDRVTKQRWHAPLDWAHQITQGRPRAGTGVAAEFADACAERGLQAACLVQYVRTAFFAPALAECPRLTLDRQVRGWRAAQFALDVPSSAGIAAFGDLCICEFKFTAAMPTIFREAIARFGLQAATASKYRATMAQILGLAM